MKEKLLFMVIVSLIGFLVIFSFQRGDGVNADIVRANMKKIEIVIDGKSIDALCAKTDDEKKIGFSNGTKNLPDAIFFDCAECDCFTMKETSIDLYIVFLDIDFEIVSIMRAAAGFKKPFRTGSNYRYVVEVRTGLIDDISISSKVKIIM